MIVKQYGPGPAGFVRDSKLPLSNMHAIEQERWVREENELQQMLTAHNSGGKQLNPSQIAKIRTAHTFEHVLANMTGKDATVIFGGKEEEAEGPSDEFLEEYLLLLGLVGGSIVQGQGPGTMEKCAKIFMGIRQLLKNFQFKVRFESRICGVPLFIGREPMHRYASNGYVTYPAQELSQRGAALLLLGNPLMILAMKGGDGTDLEVLQTLNWLKTREELKSPFTHILPNWLLVGEGNSYERLLHHWTAKTENTTPHRAERKRGEVEALRQKCYVRLEDGPQAAARRAFDSYCESFARVHGGVRADELFAFDNHVTVLEAANEVREYSLARRTGDVLRMSEAS